MRRSIRFLASAVTVLVGSVPAFADAKNPTYTDDVLPVLRQHCLSCHGPDKAKGGFNAATYSAVVQGGASGEVIKPGDPDKSRLFTLTAHKEEPKMPPKADRIPDTQVELLRLWIEQGAKESASSKVNLPAKPKVEIGLKSVGKGKPEGPPPMPLAGKLKADPVVRGRRPNAVLALAASPWAPLVAVGGQRQVLLFHADSGDLLGVLPFDHGQINSLKFSRNAKFLLAAGGRGGATGKAVLYNVETGEKVTEVGSAETDAILAADISADQSLIAVGTPTKMIRVYAIADGAVVQSIKKHTDWVCSVEFSPDGVLLATGDRNGGLFVWEAATGREFHTLRGHTACITDLSWRADSNLLATGSEDGTVRLWEMENGGQVKNWAAHPGGVGGVKFAADGRLASTGRDKLTKLWDGNGALQKQFEAFPDLGLRVAITNDNAKVVAGDWSGLVRTWTAADAKLLVAADTNPLPMVEQLKLAEAAVPAAEAKAKAAADALAAAQAKAAQANTAFATAQANAGKLTADLAAAQKAVVDHTNIVNATNPMIAPAKADADKWTAAVGVATNKAAALEVTAPAYAATAKAIQDAAAKAPTNPDLAAAAKSATATATQQLAEQAAAKKAMTDAVAAQKVAIDKLALLSKTVADNQAAVVANQAKVAALPPQVKAATDAVAPAKAAVDAANAAVGPVQAAATAAATELAIAKAKVERLKPKPPTAPPPAK